MTTIAQSHETPRDPTAAHVPLASLPDDQLLLQLSSLTRRSRENEVELLLHLGEVDARRLYAREACPSMFVYCTRILRFSEAEAYLRITAARAAREQPCVLAMLADGRLHLSAIARLAPHLTNANARAVLGRAVHRSKREILELVAELAPRPDVPAAIRALPRREVDRSASTPGSAPGALLTDAVREPNGSRMVPVTRRLRPDRVAARDELCPDRVTAPATPIAGRFEIPKATAGSAFATSAREEAPIEPLAPGRYRVRFTADRALCDKLERLRQLLGGREQDLADVIDAAVTEKLQRLESRRLAQTTRPRQTLPETDSTPTTRHLPAAVRRAVYERDGGRCRFVDRSGHRCPERQRLEFHHRHPFAMGGNHAVDNVQLLCRTHNRYIGEIDFGAGVGSRLGPRTAAVPRAHERRARDAVTPGNRLIDGILGLG
jgi:5-methylcytosine-specific restriction endonuclease McrA